MRRLATPLALALVLLASAALAGCQRIFTTSLGAALARDELPLPATLSASDAADLAAEAKTEQNVTLAAALVTNLTAQVGTTVTAATTELAAVAASSAVVASGAGSAILSVVDDFVSGGTEPTAETILSLVQSIQAGASDSVVAALKYLDPDSGGIADPDAVSSALSATDYAVAAVVLAVSALPEGFTSVEDLQADTAALATFQASAEVSSALSILQAVGDSDLVDPATQDLFDMFSGFLPME